MIIVDNPLIEYIKQKDRIDGISAMMRVRNGEDYLELCILSVIDQVDEIICVFNNCQDNTEKILLNLENKYPNKIFVYKYIPIVYPPNSSKYLETPSTSPNALNYYYNFALSKTKYSHVFKLDDDQLYHKNALTKYKKVVTDKHAVGLRGLNLVDYNCILYTNKKHQFTRGHDILLFKYNDDCHFIKGRRCEQFVGCVCENVNTAFYHLKFCKRDRGINSYELDTNSKSSYLTLSIKWFNDFIKENLLEITEDNVSIHPTELGFYFINNSIKQYNCDIFTKLEEKLQLILK